MIGFDSTRVRRARLSCTAAATLLVGPPVLAQNAEVLANLKGYGLQQYLNGHGGGSTPARPSMYTEYAAPRRSILQVSPYPYQHAVPQAVTFNPAPATQPPVVVGTAQNIQPQFVFGPAPVVLPPDAVVQRPIIVAPAPVVEAKPVAFVQAHLPPGADLFIDDKLMVSDASKPSYDLVTPPLEKGKWYSYTVVVRWVEDGKWVGQMHNFDFRAGDIHHLEVTPNGAPSVEREIAANLAKLNPDDRKAAEAQKFCAVQDTIRLGSMGVPVKVALNGKDVFLCCKGCEATARKNPEKTIATAEKFKTGK